MDIGFSVRYYDNKSVLLINQNGKLKRLYCPFRVKSQFPVENEVGNRVYWVENVNCTRSGHLKYVIYGREVSYSLFVIVATF